MPYTMETRKQQREADLRSWWILTHQPHPVEKSGCLDAALVHRAALSSCLWGGG